MTVQHFPVILTSDERAAMLMVQHDPDYLTFLSMRNLPPPEPKASGRPYIAEIRGFHATYGFDRRWMSYSQPSINQYRWFLHPGVYEIQKHQDGMPKRGFVVMTPEGKMERLTVPNVVEWIEHLPHRHLDVDADGTFHQT